jgi:hypothetical protein
MDGASNGSRFRNLKRSKSADARTISPCHSHGVVAAVVQAQMTCADRARSMRGLEPLIKEHIDMLRAGFPRPHSHSADRPASTPSPTQAASQTPQSFPSVRAHQPGPKGCGHQSPHWAARITEKCHERAPPTRPLHPHQNGARACLGRIARTHSAPAAAGTCSAQLRAERPGPGPPRPLRVRCLQSTESSRRGPAAPGRR